ncbi:hypothetical protein ACFXHA_40635 [Nocardia sp. NPDC059240]|uniref:hypothetical protein n=1 Tax=Nocardia sp. NPDC059240 TaxID=3346786 RepID=UPI0036CD738A
MAIEWYWALARMLERAGVHPDDVFDVIDAWITAKRSVWFRTATDPATGLTTFVVWGRADCGTTVAVYARPRGQDIEVYAARYLDHDQTAEFEKWEASHDD